MPGKRKALPTFATEEDELRFWDEHDPSEYIEGPSDVVVRLRRRPERSKESRTAARPARPPGRGGGGW